MRALVLLILAALCACASEVPEEPASTTAPGGGKAQGAKRFELLEPTGEIDRPPAEMRWRVGPGLMSCRAVIVTPTAEPVWTSSPSDEGSTRMPETVQSQLQPGEPYLWKVVCSFSGLQIGSDYATFTLARH
jgi:hypothetical protein